MTRYMIPLFAALLALVTALPALARDVALVIAVPRYDQLNAVPAATEADKAAEALERAGFEVIQSEGPVMEEAVDTISRFVRVLPGAERVVIFLAGHTAHGDRDSWLLMRDAPRPDLLNVGRTGLSFAGLFDLAARDGRFVLAMVAEAGAPLGTGPGLEAGPGVPPLPDRVAYVTGGIARMQMALVEDVLDEGLALKSALAQPKWGLSLHGDVPDRPLLPVSDTTPAVDPEAEARAEERGFWRAVKALNTIEAYELYLKEYPQGSRVTIARDRIVDLREAPMRAARALEEALGLDAEARRDVQRNLSILGFDPRGIDGIFGPGSRAAITAWQTDRGLDATGYLTALQVERLKKEAARRAAELEEEARRKQAELERQDSAYWRVTGQSGSEPGLRAYLDRYPDGLHADEAQARLKEIEKSKRKQAKAEDNAAWDTASQIDTVASYRKYLAAFPDGRFAEANHFI